MTHGIDTSIRCDASSLARNEERNKCHCSQSIAERLAEKLKELNMSADSLARQLQVPTNRITQILNRRRNITADTALRLAHFLGTSAEFWTNLQGLYDLRIAQPETGKNIKALPTLKRMTAVHA